MTDITEAILACEARRCAAMRSNDMEALNTLLDEELQFSHATGAVDDKTAYLAKMAQGRIVYHSIEWSSPVVAQLAPEVVLLSGRMRSAVSVNGTSKQLYNRVLAVWVARAEQWRLRAFQSTPLV